MPVLEATGSIQRSLQYRYFITVFAYSRRTAWYRRSARTAPGRWTPGELPSGPGPEPARRGARGAFSRRFFSTGARVTFLALAVSSHRKARLIDPEERRGGRDGTGRGSGRPLRGGPQFCPAPQSCAVLPAPGAAWGLCSDDLPCFMNIFNNLSNSVILLLYRAPLPSMSGKY